MRNTVYDRKRVEAMERLANSCVLYKRSLARILIWDENRTLIENSVHFNNSLMQTRMFAARFGMRFVSKRKRIPKGTGVNRKAQLVDKMIVSLVDDGKWNLSEIGRALHYSREMIRIRYRRGKNNSLNGDATL